MAVGKNWHTCWYLVYLSLVVREWLFIVAVLAAGMISVAMTVALLFWR
jgi:hypothetical protein